jgi:hypothetical protein
MTARRAPPRRVSALAPRLSVAPSGALTRRLGAPSVLSDEPLEVLGEDDLIVDGGGNQALKKVTI